MTQYVTRELLTVPTMWVEIIVRTNVIATTSVVDRGAIHNKCKKMINSAAYFFSYIQAYMN